MPFSLSHSSVLYPRLSRHWLLCIAVLALFASPARSFAIGQPRYIQFASVPRGFALAAQGRVAPLVIDSDDWWGVRHAAENLQMDLKRVTGLKPALTQGPAA